MRSSCVSDCAQHLKCWLGLSLSRVQNSEKSLSRQSRGVPSSQIDTACSNVEVGSTSRLPGPSTPRQLNHATLRPRSSCQPRTHAPQQEQLARHGFSWSVAQDLWRVDVPARGSHPVIAGVHLSGAVGLTATPYRPDGEIALLPYCSRHRLLAGRLRELPSGEA
jgi:hypothetical protein